MSWDAIVGQPLAVRLLRRALVSGKVVHAYLFVGPEGVGKRTVALELARSLNCTELTSAGSACNVCSSCRRITADEMNHPDIAIVEPDGRTIKTDQVKELRSQMYARPTQGRYRIGIVDGADRMNPESGNRVLKLLEEPPHYAVLILLAQNISGVLPTLVSRCQVIHFPPVPADQVASYLTQRRSLAAGEASLLASLSGGSIGRAMEMATDETLLQRRDKALELIGRLSRMDVFDALQFAEGMGKQKEHLDQWLELLIIWLRDALLAVQTGSDDLVINRDQMPAVRNIGERLGTEQLMVLLEAVTEVRGQMQRNVNVRLALDVLLLRLIGALKSPI